MQIEADLGARGEEKADCVTRATAILEESALGSGADAAHVCVWERSRCVGKDLLLHEN